MVKNPSATSLPIDDAQVVATIAAAERRTSGEIRVFISSREVRDAVFACRSQFEQLNMDRTKARNGVLIFIAPANQAFAVVGDRGIHERCGDAFWRQLVDAMGTHFARGDFTGGLVLGIERAADLLGKHFPRAPDDRNELPDSIARDR